MVKKTEGEGWTRRDTLYAGGLSLLALAALAKPRQPTRGLGHGRTEILQKELDESTPEALAAKYVTEHTSAGIATRWATTKDIVLRVKGIGDTLPIASGTPAAEMEMSVKDWLTEIAEMREERRSLRKETDKNRKGRE